MTSIINCSLNP